MELVRVVKTNIKLDGKEDFSDLLFMAESQLHFKDNGLLTSCIIYNEHGKPESIESLWKFNRSSGYELPEGQQFALLPRSDYEQLLENTYKYRN